MNGHNNGNGSSSSQSPNPSGARRWSFAIPFNRRPSAPGPGMIDNNNNNNGAISPRLDIIEDEDEHSAKGKRRAERPVDPMSFAGPTTFIQPRRKYQQHRHQRSQSNGEWSERDKDSPLTPAQPWELKRSSTTDSAIERANRGESSTANMAATETSVASQMAGLNLHDSERSYVYVTQTPTGQLDVSKTVDPPSLRSSKGRDRDDNKSQSSSSHHPYSQPQPPPPPLNIVKDFSIPTTEPSGLNTLFGNVHRCTGTSPRGLVGASTVIAGNKLFVFGGRRFSKRENNTLSNDLFELNLDRRHWKRVQTFGQVPAPRYFHSMCALGDHKLVCYGGMSPLPTTLDASQTAQQVDEETVVVSDVHIFDVPTRTWTKVVSENAPRARYAHCATILPSSSVFASTFAPLTAIHQNNRGSHTSDEKSQGHAIDPSGGSEMIIVGGQDAENKYIEEITVFNLRSLTWSTPVPFRKTCGMYRSVVASLHDIPASQVGSETPVALADAKKRKDAASVDVDAGPSMLMFSNFNFLDIKLELQVRSPEGALTEKTMNLNNGQSPPGLRFPTGGVIGEYFIVGGTLLSASKHEYCVYALHIKTLTWRRLDAGGGALAEGSWNRGLLWPQRNMFVILGHRKRNLVEDYNHRRLNFHSLCFVELEAFGLYENPRTKNPMSNFKSASAAILPPSIQPKNADCSGAGRKHFLGSDELGLSALAFRELTDMELVSSDGVKLPCNSRFLSRRWGAYFVQLLKEGSVAPTVTSQAEDALSDRGTLRQAPGGYRASTVTVTPSISTLNTALRVPSTLGSTTIAGSIDEKSTTVISKTDSFEPPLSTNLTPTIRSRRLFLPHLGTTLQSLLYFLHTSHLPPPGHDLDTAQILCSLLQLARPYKVDGLLEAILVRLHSLLDMRTAPAIFNATAMAAGGGRGTGFDKIGDVSVIAADDALDSPTHASETSVLDRPHPLGPHRPSRDKARAESFTASAKLETRPASAPASEDDASSVSSSDISEAESTNSQVFSDAEEVPRRMRRRRGKGRGGGRGRGRATDEEEEIWAGDQSCVVGLQKAALRGLMAARAAREKERRVVELGTENVI